MNQSANAGADIEKELAERTGSTLQQLAERGYDTDFGSESYDGLIRYLAAALLAKAGERAKLEEELDVALRTIRGLENSYVYAGRRAVAEAERRQFAESSVAAIARHIGLPVEQQYNLPDIFSAFDDAAERARGLEAEINRLRIDLGVAAQISADDTLRSQPKS